MTTPPAQAAYIRLDEKVLAGCRRDPDRLARVVGGELKVGRRLDIGPAWDALHYLLSARRRAGATGDAGDPFGLALFGGELLNADAMAPRPAVRWLAPEAVVRVFRALEQVGGGDLSRHYDPAAMDAAAVAPGDWAARGDAGFEFLLDAFLQWRELYQRAVEDGQAVLCVMDSRAGF